MKTTNVVSKLTSTSAVLVSLCLSNELQAQGTIDFDLPWVGYPGEIYILHEYQEEGFWFRITNSFFRPSISEMGRRRGESGDPAVYNGTPYMYFLRGGFDDYVLISRTDGGAFGLVSVDLADLMAPSLNPISITFEGYRPGFYNPFVSVTFTTSGGGISSFESFTFPSDFGSGLRWVAVTSPRWAMDNLRWVPEPGTYVLIGLGLLGLAWHRFHKRRKL